MLLDIQAAGEILHADVVHVQVMARGYRANAVENIFGALGAGQWLHGHVGVGQDAVDGGGYGGHQLLGTLEGYGAGEAYGEIGEVAVAGAADAHAIDFKDAFHVEDCIGDLGANAGGSGVEQGVDGAAGQAPADGDDHASHK